MMEPEEVYNGLEYLISEECADTQHDFVEEIEFAMKSIQKQIPMEPKKEFVTVFIDKHALCYQCRNCSHYWFDKRYQYCPNCGQKNKWDGVE